MGLQRILVVTVAGLAMALAGCGRRGALEPPPDPTAAVTPADASPQLQTGLRRPKAVPIAKPHEPFLLDPLL